MHRCAPGDGTYWHLVGITISREVAMTGIGEGGRVSGNGRKDAEVSDADEYVKVTS